MAPLLLPGHLSSHMASPLLSDSGTVDSRIELCVSRTGTHHKPNIPINMVDSDPLSSYTPETRTVSHGGCLPDLMPFVTSFVLQSGKSPLNINAAP